MNKADQNAVPLSLKHAVSAKPGGQRCLLQPLFVLCLVVVVVVVVVVLVVLVVVAVVVVVVVVVVEATSPTVT